MRKICAILVALTFIAATGCKKNDAAKSSETLTTKYAKVLAGVYKENTLAKNTWATTLEKGEPVGLLAEETIKNEKISKIKLSDDSIGYIKSENLAVKPIVFIDNNVRVYQRNNINSGEFAIIPAGTLGFVIEEKADWFQIDIGVVAGKKVYGKWVKGGISDSAELIADAVSLEKVRKVLSETIQGDKQEALNLLRSIAEKNNAVGLIAKNDLAKIEGSAPPADTAAPTPQQ
jgi:hypothetical protein